MAFPKITETLTANKGVTGLPDTPELSAGDMQKKFDELSTDVIIPFVNEHIDLLNGEDGATNIGAKPTTNMSGVESNLQDILEALDNMTHTSLDGATFSVNPSSGHMIITYADGTTGDLGAVAFAPKGTYSSTTTYEKFSIVDYNNVLYIAIDDVPIGTLPTDTTHWNKFIDIAATVQPEIDSINNNLCDYEERGYLGKNLIDSSKWYDYGISDSGALLNDKRVCHGEVIKVNPSTTYTISVGNNVNALLICEYNSNNAFIRRIRSEASGLSNITKIFTFETSSSTEYVVWCLNYDNSTNITSTIINGLNLQLERGNARTSYVSYVPSNSEINSKLCDLVKGTLTSGQTSIELSDTRITTNSLVEPFFWVTDGTAIEPISYATIKVETGKVTMTFDALETDIQVGVRVV